MAQLSLRCRRRTETTKTKSSECRFPLPPAEAMDKAVDECIRKGILAEFLTKNKKEVVTVKMFECDYEDYVKIVQRDSYKDGWGDGREEGKEEGRTEGISWGLERGKASVIMSMYTKGCTFEQIADLSGIDICEVRNIIREQELTLV